MLNQDVKVQNKVQFIDLSRQYLALREKILQTVDEVLTSGQYILGKYVEEFEHEICNFLGCKYALGVANGTDAIIMVLKSLGLGSGDEVILPVNSFLATAGAVRAIDATPVLCDVSEDLNIDVAKIESLITHKTKAIIPVHLTGRPADMDPILVIANKHSLYLIEDAAQSIGALYKNKMSGTIGNTGCFSLHPLKNLHVYGDGGLITTNDEALYESLKVMRNHGLVSRDRCIKWGLNSRLDSLQAAIGSVNLPYLAQWNNRRREIAAKYNDALRTVVRVPEGKDYEYSIYHNYVVFAQNRDHLSSFLAENGIETKIHYPIQIHEQPAAKELGYKSGDFPVAEKLAKQMLSLPVYAELSDMEQTYVIQKIQEFYHS